MNSPVGKLTLAATDRGLAAVLWEHERAGRVPVHLEREDNGHPVLVEAERQLDEYFAGRRTRFALTLDMSGTPFQRTVWNALLTIPYGETRSYAQIATSLNRAGLRSAFGKHFTTQHVGYICRRDGLTRRKPRSGSKSTHRPDPSILPEIE